MKAKDKSLITRGVETGSRLGERNQSRKWKEKDWLSDGKWFYCPLVLRLPTLSNEFYREHNYYSRERGWLWIEEQGRPRTPRVNPRRIYIICLSVQSILDLSFSLITISLSVRCLHCLISIVSSSHQCSKSYLRSLPYFRSISHLHCLIVS